MFSTSPKPKNIVQKIWEKHVVKQKPNHPAVLAIDLQLLHEVTSPQGFQMLRDKDLPVKFPQKQIATLDHSIPTRKNREEIYDETARKQVETLRKNVNDFGIVLKDFGSGYQGIVHVIGPSLGLTQPGMTIVCGDSHTATHGAFGALAFGIGSTEVGLVLATGCLLQSEPKTMQVDFTGKLPKGVYSKDMILNLISRIGVGGGNKHVFEYTGEAIRELSMEARMSICNMSIEGGARSGLVSPDEKTFAYIKGKKHAPSEEKWEEAVEYWKSFASEEGCQYDKIVQIETDKLSPMVTWGTNPAQGIQIDDAIPNIGDLPEDARLNAQNSLKYTDLNQSQKMLGLPVQWVFLGSCTNSRIEDLRLAAGILKNKKIKDGVTMFVVPGSEQVKKQSEEEGLDKIFKQAGAVWRNPGCSMCLGMNDDKVPAGERCVSTSNRNFVGRQGTGSITHLASPATAVASAIEGRIADPREYL